MKFKNHSSLEGTHAVYGASQYHWLNYDEEKIKQSYINKLAVLRGTKLHDFCKRSIELGIKLPRTKSTINQYVNDAIGFRMSPEVLLYYSQFFYGTADTISFEKGFLRIHDSKTGITPTSFNQTNIYDALFCLEYRFSPFDIEREHRIYQNDDYRINNPDPMIIRKIMDKIISFDKILSEINETYL